MPLLALVLLQLVSSSQDQLGVGGAAPSSADAQFTLVAPIAAAPAAERIDRMHQVLATLDVASSSAMVAAHDLARRLLYAAVYDGDRRLVASAHGVLSEAAERGVGGSWVRTLRQFADALRAADDDAALAIDRLDGVFATALAQGWLELAVHAACEGAAQEVRRDHLAAAVERIDRLAAAFRTPAQHAAWSDAARLLLHRLGDAAPEVLEPFDHASQLFDGARPRAAVAELIDPATPREALWIARRGTLLTVGRADVPDPFATVVIRPGEDQVVDGCGVRMLLRGAVIALVPAAMLAREDRAQVVPLCAQHALGDGEILHMDGSDALRVDIRADRGSH